MMFQFNCSQKYVKARSRTFIQVCLSKYIIKFLQIKAEMGRDRSRGDFSSHLTGERFSTFIPIPFYPLVFHPYPFYPGLRRNLRN